MTNNPWYAGNNPDFIMDVENPFQTLGFFKFVLNMDWTIGSNVQLLIFVGNHQRNINDLVIIGYRYMQMTFGNVFIWMRDLVNNNWGDHLYMICYDWADHHTNNVGKKMS